MGWGPCGPILCHRRLCFSFVLRRHVCIACSSQGCPKGWVFGVVRGSKLHRLTFSQSLAEYIAAEAGHCDSASLRGAPPLLSTGYRIETRRAEPQWALCAGDP